MAITQKESSARWYANLPEDKKAEKLARGLLCNWCNRGLGLFKDNPAVLVKASAYLKGAL